MVQNTAMPESCLNLSLVFRSLNLWCFEVAYACWASQVCGAVVSVRKQNSKIALWTRNAAREVCVLPMGDVAMGDAKMISQT